MRRLALHLWWSLLAVFRLRPCPFMPTHVDDVPDTLHSRRVYVITEDGEPRCIVLLCPCGCGQTIHLNLLSQTRPCWTYEIHRSGTISLTPSIWRTKGCNSHFFIKRGKLIWCPDAVPTGKAIRG